MQAAEALQAKHLAFLTSGDLDGLLAECYTADARLHAFRFRADGPEAIKDVLARYGQRLAGLGERQISHFLSGDDFVWQEVTIQEPSGQIVIYEFKFLRNGKVYLQLLGEKEGSVWLPDDFVDFTSPDVAMAERVHHDYINYQAKQDVNGMVSDFFTPDARLITAKLRIEGEEALRSFFTGKFEHERNFHLVSIRNLNGDHDYVWFEATAASSAGSRTVYDVMLVRDGMVSLQLVGTLDGVLPADKQS